jgi:hypothetical protein
MRWTLIIYLFAAFGSEQPVQPIAISQSTEVSCGKAAEKVKADVQKQAPQTSVITVCVDKGSAY